MIESRPEQKPDVRFASIGATMSCVFSSRRVLGKLPAWFWRDFAGATSQAGERIPALVIEDGDRILIVMAVEDYNRVVAGVAANGLEWTTV